MLPRKRIKRGDGVFEVTSPGSFDWEQLKHEHDCIPFARNRFKNRCSSISSMEHTLVAAFEAKINLNVKHKQTEGYHFSSHSLIFNCVRVLSSYGLDPHQELSYACGIKALGGFSVFTRYNHVKMDCPATFVALEKLYYAGDELLPGRAENAWDKAMRYIHNICPVVATIKYFDDFQNFDHTGGPYRAIGGHGEEAKSLCVLLVGYNSTDRTFTYLNSEGIEFGDNGRAKVEFNSVLEIYAPMFEGDSQAFEDSELITRFDPLPPTLVIRNWN